MFRLYALLLAILLTPAAFGQARLKVPATPDGTIENLVTVTVPAPRGAAVSEAHGWLAFGHHFKYTDATVTLFRLGEAGKAGEPILLKLPRPEALAKYPQHATGLAFHPKLPLLYVWQDIEFPKNESRNPLPLSAGDEAAVAEFDHLLIYNLEKGQPELLVGLARGTAFAYSRPVGSVVVDQAGERLYIPNLSTNAKHSGTTIGSFVLHPDGIPVVGDPEADQGKSAKREEHIASINGAKQANKPVLPQRIAPGAGYAFYSDSAVGSGIGFVTVDRDKVFTGGFHATALSTWTPEDRRTKLQTYHIDSEYTYKRITGHPTLPLIFLTDCGSQYLFRFEHADGNLTLVPQRAELEGARNLSSAPVYLPKTNQVAVGGWDGRVHVVSLNDQGKFKLERQQALVAKHAIEALAYSVKYDRLYVGVEKPK